MSELINQARRAREAWRILAVAGTEKKNQAELIIAKQRNGPTGTVNLVWLPDYTKFVNMEK